ncbi:hypothetical protein [Diaphorobacter aerolatus]|uniref:Uncharacterized protein n=1 Tax=Diaphorobacter aerolatus TaxID=1288495 RepID=A0A7H0GKY1_9BURK|nr:hypothetical protein [Diaphorobacter aerolatus]QNP48947.1 hypothetical protein H9K75_01750 [Diaphorobacter aerolatus]
MPQTPNPPATRTPEVQVNTEKPGQAEDPGSTAKLPHERDQSTSMTGGNKSPEMEQAHKDVKRGLRDTDARGADGRPVKPRQPVALRAD